MASLKALQAKARLEKKISKGIEEEKRSVNESGFFPAFDYLPPGRRVDCYELTQNFPGRSDFYHVYFDPTDCFQYEITLIRDDEEMGILGERYVVKVSHHSKTPFL